MFDCEEAPAGPTHTPGRFQEGRGSDRGGTGAEAEQADEATQKARYQEAVAFLRFYFQPPDEDAITWDEAESGLFGVVALLSGNKLTEQLQCGFERWRDFLIKKGE